MPERRDRRAGFTLIEILIVIAIISILASLSLAGVIVVKNHAQKSHALAFVAAAGGAAEQYHLDTGAYPRAKEEEVENEFPALFEALCEERPPQGHGGPSGPYLSFRRADVFVPEDDGESYRQATAAEIDEPGTPRYVLDPWGHPYVYRENRSRPPRPYSVRPRRFDLYSLGPDGIDQTRRGEPGDDIGDW